MATARCRGLFLFPLSSHHDLFFAVAMFYCAASVLRELRHLRNDMLQYWVGGTRIWLFFDVLCVGRADGSARRTEGVCAHNNRAPLKKRKETRVTAN
jgi:hypothetical protein